MSNVDGIFDQMVEEFRKNKNKQRIVEMMIDFCKENEKEDVYELRKKMEVEFAKRVNCRYCYSGINNLSISSIQEFTVFTPDDYGCDLREILYDRKGNLISNGQELLDLFKTKKMDDMLHIMTDIDDTLYPNTEHSTYIAGSDISWKQKTAYPGIIKFYQQFHKRPRSNYSTILSATPGCFKTGKLKSDLLQSILGDKYGFIQGIESKSEIVSYVGEIISNYRKPRQNASDKPNDLFELFGETKFRRFKEYTTLFPEYIILFIGDNGQGDVLCGKKMITHDNGRHYVFIHQVSEDGMSYKIVEKDDSKNFYFFNNYYALSKIFEDLGFFIANDVNEVKRSVVEELKVGHRESDVFKRLNPEFFDKKGGKSKKNKKEQKRTKKSKKSKKRQ